MTDRAYSVDQLAGSYQISRQQALRYITRFGANRAELDHLLCAAARTGAHRKDDMERTASEVAVG
jgi:hypothetical protein